MRVCCGKVHVRHAPLPIGLVHLVALGVFVLMLLEDYPFVQTVNQAFFQLHPNYQRAARIG